MMEGHHVSHAAGVDPELRLAELDAQLRAVRRDYQEKLSELARRATESREGSRVVEPGLYEMLLRVERERQQLEALLEAERGEQERLAAQLGAEQTERRRLEALLGAERLVYFAREPELAAGALAAIERDALAARVAELEGELRRVAYQAAVFEDRARVLEQSLSWRLGHAILAAVKRIPGVRRAGRALRRGS
jgi:DNA-binding protein Fis